MPFKSNYPDVHIPDTDIFGTLFERKSKPFPDDKPIYVDADTKRTYTWLDVKNTAIDFGKGLKSQWEWKKGDVLALFTPNNIDVPCVIWGTHWAGGIVSPANPGYTVEELAFQLKDSGAKALVTQMAMMDTARKACDKVGIPHERIIILGDERDPNARIKHFKSIRLTGGASRWRRTKAAPKSDLAFLVYSSGTTGYPKGVMLSHGNIVSDLMMLEAGEGGMLSPDGGKDGKGDRLLAFLPFFHIYGLTCFLHFAIWKGLTLFVMSKFDLNKFCQHVQELKITFAYIVPPVVLLLAKDPAVSKYDLSSLRMVNSGAAPLTRDLVDAFHKRLNLPVKQGYGLSETSPTTHTQPWKDWWDTVGSVGQMLPNQIAKFVDVDGNEVPVGQTGELWISGPNVFLGYLNNVEGTKNALTDDGYFKTGDVGHIDDKGNFYITDRVKELIKYKGFQVPPAELEGLLIGHPKVADVAVIGIFIEEQATEVPRAYIKLAGGQNGSKELEKEISDWLAAKVANHKRLRGGIRFLDEVPKSASGKILRRVLKDQALKEIKDQKPKAKL